MDKITRAIITSTIFATGVTVENGKVVNDELPAVMVIGKELTVGSKEATAAVKKQYPEVVFVVRAVEVTKKVYEMTVGQFITLATVVPPKDQTEKSPDMQPVE